MTRSDVIAARLKVRGFDLWETGLGSEYRHVIGPRGERYGILKLSDCAARFLDGATDSSAIALSQSSSNPVCSAAMAGALTGEEPPPSRSGRGSSTTNKKARR